MHKKLTSSCPLYTISVLNLVKTYNGARALDGLTFSVERSAICGLLGANGAGKSTTVRVLTSLTRPDSGSALVAGFDAVQAPQEVRRRIGYVAQKSTLDGNATGLENLRLQGRLYGLRGLQLTKRIDFLVSRFDLRPLVGAFVRTYSGGMQRRLEIAMGLLHSPEVLILDEPTTALDPQARIRVWNLLRDLAGEGLTVLFTTHDLEEADQISTKVAILEQGRVVAAGQPASLKQTVLADSLEMEFLSSVDAENAREILDQLAEVHDARCFGNHLAVRARDSMRAAPIVIATLRDAMIRVIAVRMRQPSLSDVYLHYAQNDRSLGSYPVGSH